MAAAGARTLRRWGASLAVTLVFTLGATWAFIVFKIAGTMGRCPSLVEGSVWADDMCRRLMPYPSAVAAVSLLLMLWLCRRELKAEAEAEGPDRRRAIVVIYSLCLLVMILGGMVGYSGESLLLKDPADEGAAAQVQTGLVISDVGLLAFEFGHCLLFIPYMLLRLMRPPW